MEMCVQTLYMDESQKNATISSQLKHFQTRTHTHCVYQAQSLEWVIVWFLSDFYNNSVAQKHGFWCVRTCPAYRRKLIQQCSPSYQCQKRERAGRKSHGWGGGKQGCWEGGDTSLVGNKRGCRETSSLQRGIGSKGAQDVWGKRGNQTQRLFSRGTHVFISIYSWNFNSQNKYLSSLWRSA